MAALSVLAALSLVASVQGGIYPDGHWDHATKLTTENADSFVKENVDAGKTVRTIHGTEQSPGAGGWPTVRHFNKATGYGGEKYNQKTSTAMCDELGPKTEYMQQHVEETSGTSLCNVNNTEKGCTDKQKDFITKWAEKPKDEVKKQLERLQGMVDTQGASMKPEALTWAKHRVGIFKQLAKTEKEEL